MSRRARARRQRWQLLEGDSHELLSHLPAASVDALVTDPPYGLSGDADALAMLEAWLSGKPYEHRSKGGFMGKDWDSFVPGPELWREAYRVLKPGAHLLVFAGTRTLDVMALSLRLAGLQLRDTVLWMYGQGFPKSLNFQGFGTALKPSYEPILLFRKPCAGTVARTFERYGTGALNIDAARIATACPRPLLVQSEPHFLPGGVYSGRQDGSLLGGSRRVGTTTFGRWPANTVLSHSDSCTVVHRHETRAIPKQAFSFKESSGNPDHEVVFDGEDIICSDECPIKMLDSQSGELHSGTRDGKRKVHSSFGGDGFCEKVRDTGRFYGASRGGASRFLYCAKPDRTERDMGCHHLPRMTGGELTGRKEGSAGLKNPRAGAGRTSGGANIHNTVKPIRLMRWLCRLITPPGGLVLDPFAGSGTTGIAANAEGLRFLGMEQSAEYAAIARARLIYAVLHPDKVPKP